MSVRLPSDLCSCGEQGPVAPIGCVGFGFHARGDLMEWDEWKYMSHRMYNIRAFRLLRPTEEYGKIVERIVASGVVLPTGRVVIEWMQPRATLGIYKDFKEFESVHVEGHLDGSRVVWVDGTRGQQLGYIDPFSPEQINAALEKEEPQ